jgi:hypothetical protein
MITRTEHSALCAIAAPSISWEQPLIAHATVNAARVRIVDPD